MMSPSSLPDLALTGASMINLSIIAPLISYDYLRYFATKYLGTFDASDSLAAPLHGHMKGLPPLLVQVGTDERLIDDSPVFRTRGTGGRLRQARDLGGHAARLSARRGTS